MYELENDDELLLLELERRDGIYSFIFHEMEDQSHKVNDIKIEETKMENNLKKNNKNDILLDTKFDVIMSAVSNPSSVSSHYNSNACIFLNGNSKNTVTNNQTNGTTLSANIISNIWQPSAAAAGAGNPHGFPFNFPFQINAATHCRFKSPSTNRAWQVREAKPSFSHVYAPLVRNRQHKLKETAEYKNFEKGLKKVADLRQLFPLDPDVYAPFAEMKMEAENKKSNGSVVVEIKKC